MLIKENTYTLIYPFYKSRVSTKYLVERDILSSYTKRGFKECSKAIL